MGHDHIAGFWTWFEKNSTRLQGDASCADEVTHRLRTVDPELCWEIGRSDHGAWDFAIRTEDPATRWRAFVVVEAAPSLPDWSIMPFRTSGDVDADLEWGDGTKWSSSDFTASVSPVRDGPFLDLVLAHPGFKRVRDEDRAGPGFTMLDAALGEELMHDAIDGVEFVAGPPQAIPLLKLRAGVQAAIKDLRTRAPRGKKDAWLAATAGKSKRPLSFILAEALDLRKVGQYPWLLELKVRVKSADRRGLPGTDELKRLQDIEVPLEKTLRSDRPMIFWGSCTGEGRRHYFFYSPGPVTGLQEHARSAMKSLGLSGSVELRHDARWAEWRGLIRQRG